MTKEDSIAIELERVIGALAKELGLAGAFVYAFAWTADVGFYSQFDVTPSDVGVSHETVVTQAAVALLFAAGIVGLTVTVASVLAKVVSNRLSSALSVTITLSILAVLYSTAGSRESELLWLFALYATAVGTAIILTVRYCQRRHVWIAIVGALATVPIGLVVSYKTGVETASSLVREGRLALGNERVELSGLLPSGLVHFVEWTVPSVDVQSPAIDGLRNGTALDGSTAGFYLLGRADGQLTIWDVCFERVIVIPASTAVVINRSPAPAAAKENRFGGGFSCGAGGGI